MIVSGGAINSPQILELPGIGSTSVLEKAGVTVVVDLPEVGENLSDRSATGISILGIPKHALLIRVLILLGNNQ